MNDILEQIKLNSFQNELEKIAVTFSLFKRTNTFTGLSGLLKKLGPTLGKKRIPHVRDTVLASTSFKPSSTPIGMPSHTSKLTTSTKLGKFKI